MRFMYIYKKWFSSAYLSTASRHAVKCEVITAALGLGQCVIFGKTYTAIQKRPLLHTAAGYLLSGVKW